ncbi:hypothetical protein P5673_022598 [Acropora cervicornis]|uniref:Uncharacterized protein n=1 Tax=Acropora cervicornis TaxID=6130 RepID=A0AAD9Q6B0_ACRCE|nr:hypothetical protein P5673_022598 [Acropora cervicornis]
MTSGKKYVPQGCPNYYFCSQFYAFSALILTRRVLSNQTEIIFPLFEYFPNTRYSYYPGNNELGETNCNIFICFANFLPFCPGVIRVCLVVVHSDKKITALRKGLLLSAKRDT